MKKGAVFIYIFLAFILVASVFVYINKSVIFQCGNPIPYIYKMFLLNGDTTYADVFNDNNTYITKRYDSDELFRFVENEYDVIFKEQAGSGFLFESDATEVILSSQIYWRYYMVWDLNVHHKE